MTALWIGLTLLGAGVLIVALAMAGLLGLAAYLESRADDARPDDTMAVADAVREDQGDVAVQRAEPWPPSPAIVAGSDLDGTVLANELEAMLIWHDAGANVCEGAPRDVVRYG